MFPQVSPLLFALDFASLTTIAFCALCFHGLTNCFSRNSFRFTSIQIARGGMGVTQAKPSAEFVQWTLTSVHSSTYELFVAAKNSNSFVFSQIQTLWAKHPGWGTPPTRQCSESRFFRGVKIGPQLGKLPPTRLGAIIPLCTLNIRRRAFISLANCHCFSWG